MDYFDRSNPPDYVDYSNFTEFADVKSLVKSTDFFRGDRTIISQPSLRAESIEHFGRKSTEHLPAYLKPINMHFSAAFLRSSDGYFIPRYGFNYYEHDEDLAVAKEYLWLSYIFWSQYLRCDLRTNWRCMMAKDIDYTIIDEPICVAWGPHSGHIFHWLIDCLPRIWLLKNKSPHNDRRFYVGELTQDSMQHKFLRSYGIEFEDLIDLKPKVCKLSDAVFCGFEFREDVGLRPSQTTGEHAKGWSPEYLQDLRDRGISLVGIPARSGCERIYVTRRDAQHRKLINEDQLVSHLEGRGFTVICPGDHPIEEQVEIFSKAKIIIGAHGGGLTNVIWAPDDAVVIEIVPEGFFDPGYRVISHLQGRKFMSVFGRMMNAPEGSTDDSIIKFADIIVDLKDVDLALAAAA